MTILPKVIYPFQAREGKKKKHTLSSGKSPYKPRKGIPYPEKFLSITDVAFHTVQCK